MENIAAVKLKYHISLRNGSIKAKYEAVVRKFSVNYRVLGIFSTVSSGICLNM